MKKYVSIKRLIDDKFVEFYFAIGDATLSVELIMPVSAYEEFCKVNNVIEMNAEQKALIVQEEEKWRFGEFRDEGE
ncbi:MAG: phenol hydroxylase subunit [Porticoccaceae bacterium]